LKKKYKNKIETEIISIKKKINEQESKININKSNIITFINTRNPEFFNIKDNDGYNILHISLLNNYPSEIINTLLEKADYLASEKNNLGEYPLQCAIKKYSSPLNNKRAIYLKELVIIRLLQLCPVAGTEKVMGRTPLQYALLSKCSDNIINAIINLIIKQNPDKNKNELKIQVLQNIKNPTDKNVFTRIFNEIYKKNSEPRQGWI